MKIIYNTSKSLGERKRDYSKPLDNKFNFMLIKSRDILVLFNCLNFDNFFKLTEKSAIVYF